MRDRVSLATDLYLPSNGGPKFPTLVIRTPYGKPSNTAAPVSTAVYLAQHGYAVVVQDVRGRGLSEGIYYPFTNDGKDGYNTIEWAAKQDWSNGQAGTLSGYTGLQTKGDTDFTVKITYVAPDGTSTIWKPELSERSSGTDRIK
ncbi:CocE/NonD family hydrolase [Effusibacillus dendaii]|uniref:CocE/NonD family hydrolase n=1 Tax=Effusibacillus dendaii TaxID=2743772 RepID=UPI0019091724|nr:CocE/NonD family hydrolase [Effusibacillus dendaii]